VRIVSLHRPKRSERMGNDAGVIVYSRSSENAHNCTTFAPISVENSTCLAAGTEQIDASLIGRSTIGVPSAGGPERQSSYGTLAEEVRRWLF